MPHLVQDQYHIKRPTGPPIACSGPLPLFFITLYHPDPRRHIGPPLFTHLTFKLDESWVCPLMLFSRLHLCLDMAGSFWNKLAADMFAKRSWEETDKESESAASLHWAGGWGHLRKCQETNKRLCKTQWQERNWKEQCRRWTNLMLFCNSKS